MKRPTIHTLLNSKQYGYCGWRNEPTITRYSHNSFAKFTFGLFVQCKYMYMYIHTYTCQLHVG